MPPRNLVLSLAVLLLGAACGRGGATEPADASAGGRAVIVEVTDGDTIRVRIGGGVERVRLIGIDTPETHGQGGLRECFGREASQRTAQLLPEGANVRLVRDVEARDRYGRLLAYVYKHDGTFVNMALAREGFAAPLTIAPNVAHSDAFVRAAADARDENLGLWGKCGGADTPLQRITEQGSERAPLPSHP